MSFQIKNFSPLGGNSRSGLNEQGFNAPMGWSYQSTVDDLAAILTVDYFKEVSNIVAAGQFIYVDLLDGKFIVTILFVDRESEMVGIDSKTFSPVGSPLLTLPKVLTIEWPHDNLVSGNQFF